METKTCAKCGKVAEQEDGMDCPECGKVAEQEDGMDCPECGQFFCDNCYDCGLGDGSKAKYTLEGREAVFQGESGECISGKCIFCGKELHHFNCHGEGWLLGAKVEGKAVEFLYCKDYDCTKGMGKAIWRCGCVNNYMENVGESCHACGCLRKNAKPVPE